MSTIKTLVLECRCRMVRSLPAVDSQWKNKGGRRKQSHLLSCLLKLQRRYAMGWRRFHCHYIWTRKEGNQKMPCLAWGPYC